jgi:hypothetical protein
MINILDDDAGPFDIGGSDQQPDRQNSGEACLVLTVDSASDVTLFEVALMISARLAPGTE